MAEKSEQLSNLLALVFDKYSMIRPENAADQTEIRSPIWRSGFLLFWGYFTVTANIRKEIKF